MLKRSYTFLEDSKLVHCDQLLFEHGYQGAASAAVQVLHKPIILVLQYPMDHGQVGMHLEGLNHLHAAPCVERFGGLEERSLKGAVVYLQNGHNIPNT